MKKVQKQMKKAVSIILLLAMVFQSSGFTALETQASVINQYSSLTKNEGDTIPASGEPDDSLTVTPAGEGNDTVTDGGGAAQDGAVTDIPAADNSAKGDTAVDDGTPADDNSSENNDAPAEVQTPAGDTAMSENGAVTPDDSENAGSAATEQGNGDPSAADVENPDAQTPDVNAVSEGQDEPAVVDTEDSTTKGSIMFQIHWNDEIDTASDTPRYFDWSEITRPSAVPNDPNELVRLYRYKKTESGDVDESTIEQLTLQNGNHGGENFCQITITEGEPYWSVTVGNVSMPEGYHFYAEGPGVTSYQATEKATEKPEEEQTSEELKLNYVEYELDYQPLKISKKVIPADASPEFSFNVNVKVSDANIPYKGAYTVTGSADSETTQTTKTTTNGVVSGVHDDGKVVLNQIPAGVAYEVTEVDSGNYKIIYDENTKTGKVDANGTSATTVTNLSNNVTVSFNKIWNDNNDPDRSEADFIAALQFEYKVGNGEWTAFSEGSAPFSSVDFSIDKSGYNSWVVYAVHWGNRNFPSAVIKEDGTFDLIEYRITEGPIKGYISTTAEDGTVTNTKSMDFSAGIEWKDDSDVANRPKTVNLKLNAYYVDGNNERHDATADELKALGIPNAVVSTEVSKDTDTTSVSIPNLPMYTSEGYPLIYYLEQETLTGYSSTYDNQGTNYALNETACFSGGKIINLRRDYTTFSATKQWIDAGNDDTSKRPKAMVYLYRYAEGQTEADATPVTILDKNGKSFIVHKEIPDADINGTSTISFEDVLENIDEDGHKLFKYDAEGRAYIYLVKEILIPNYSDGGEQTNLEYYKTYYDRNGKVVSSLLEGGEVVNRRMPMADVQVQKSWVAASFPGAANGTEVTMKVKVSEDDGTNWTYLKDNEGNDLEITVSGFSQDQLTVGQTMTLPMYNEDGKALQYQAEEISVKKNGTEVFDQTTGQTVIDGHTFQCTAAPLIMSSVTEPADSNQNAKAELTCSNTLADQADLTIIKNWSGITPEDTYVVNVQVKRYLYTGAEDTHFEPVLAAVKGEEGFTNTISGLPLYDAEGYPYEYRTTELSVTNNGEEVTKTWSTICDYHYDYNKKEITSTITNYRGGGGTYRSVRKTWLDDGCVEGRLPVTAQVYDSEGNPWEGKSVELSQANGWEGRIYFSEEDMLDERYTAGVVIKESKVGTYDVDYNGETPGYTNQTSADGMTGVVRTDETNGFIFIVTNTNNEDGSAEIVNRRVGKIQIHIEKEWIDGSRENASRPALSVDVYRDDQDQKFATITLDSDDQAGDGDNQNKWVKLSDSFDKYDKNGKQYTYTVQEVVSQDLKTDDYLTESKVGTYDTTASRYHSGDIQNFSITNRREGETAFTVNKIWHDTEGTATHPDIRVELYYQAKDADSDALTYYKYGEGPYSELMQDPIDYVWSEAGAGAAYDVSCTVNRLPKYAEDGSLINYFCKEVMPVPGDYKTFYWKESGCQEKSGANEAGYAADGEFIENRPEAKININGTKLWLNLQAGTKAEDINSSGIHITLYHYVGTQPADFETNPSKYEVKSITLAEASAANKNRTFLFSNVDKYDALGRKYTFEMRETIDGKLGYVYSNDPSGFRITNTFLTGSENNRTIQVNKDWDSKKYTEGIRAGQEFEYPDTVFKLYRSAGKSDTDNEIDLNGEPIATITLSAARGQNSGTMEFPAQLIWSENGIQYKYAVVEVVDGVPSYQIPAEKQTVYISDKDRNGNDITYTPDNKPGVRTAHFENTYEPKSGFLDLQLQGAKYWKDANGAHRPDPADLVLNVYRSAPGTALSTAMPEVQLRYGTDYTIRWTTTTAENCWYYTIKGDAITEFAPNGQRFVYRITEEVPEGYKVSGGASQKGEVNNAKTQRMTDMTNTLTGTYTVSKRWDDNNNEYALRPVSVVVVLQRSNDNGANWEYVTTTNNTDDKLYDVPGETGVKALSVELNVGNKWKYTFENLDPTYIYRAEEVAAGSKDGTGDKTIYPYWRNTSEGDRHMIGSYNMSYDYSDTQTTVTNKLDPTTLSVTKIWAGDNNNYYDSRPLNDAGVPTVTVKIQRKYWNEDDGEDDANWKDVLNTNGKPVTKVLSSTDNSHTWEYGNLPKCDYLGRNYEYRAVEITDNVQGYEAAHASGNLNQIFIQNKLTERTLSISVEKKWSEGAVDSHYPVVIELTRWVPSGTGPNIKVPYPQPMTITLDGTPDDMTNTPAGESSAWVATWNHLPEKDNDGNDYIYKVEEISINGTPVEKKKAAGYLVDNGVENDELMVWDADSTVEIRNTLAMEYKVSKEFENDTYADRPSSVTVQLQRTTATTIDESTSWENVGEETEIEGFTNEAGKTEVAQVSYTFEDLPKYDTNNQLYTYRAVETKIGTKAVTNNFASGYDVTYENADTDETHYGSKITNTMRTIDIQGTKEWDDQSDFYEMRPESVTVKLYANNTLVAKQPDAVWTNTASGNTWNFTFSDLPQYDVNGDKIVYTVKEPTANIPVGYTAVNNSLSGDFAAAADSTSAAKTTVNVSAEYDGADHGIINKLETVDVTGTKTWAGESANGTYTTIKPDSIEVKLMNGNTEVNVPATSYTAAVAEPAEGIDAWTYTFTNVPKYDKDGKLITYKVVETKVPGYTESRDKSNDNLITNTLDKTTLTATKVWDDQNNKYSTRPTDWNKTDGTGLFTVYADYGDGAGFIKMTTQPTCTWTGSEGTDGKGTYTFTAANLQKYNLVSGAAVEIQYKVQEDTTPSAYTQSETTAADGTKTITNTLDVSSINVTKTWVDNSNFYGTRPSDLTLTLQWKKTLKAGGETDWVDVDPAPAYTWSKSGNTWTCSFADLPNKDVDGNGYSYRIKETVPTGYYSDKENDTVDAAIADGTGTVAFTNTLYTVNVTGTKTWDDQDNHYQIRPASVSVKLYNGTTQVAKQPVPTWTKPEGNTWTFLFSGLPMYDASGNRISYSAKEVGAITGYTVSNNELTGDFSAATNGATITVAKDGNGIINTLDVVDVTGTKTWAGDTDDDINGTRKDIRPDSIEVKLMNGDNEVTVPDASYTAASSANNWTYTFVNVPKYDSTGAQINYTVVETAVPGYTESRDETNDKLITNTLDTVDLTATKVWVDENDKYSTRPDGWDNTDGTGLFTVYADYGDGKGYDAMTEQPECKWDDEGSGIYTFTVENLQKYNLVDGAAVEILYKVQEDTTPSAYTQTVSEDGKTITNTLDVSSINVTKTWVDHSNAYGTRPDNLALTLQWKRAADADWSNVSPAPTVSWTKNTDNTWSYTYTGLPDKDVNGNTYSYRVKETVPTGYHTAENADIAVAAISDGTGSVTFTNTFDYGFVQINKVFADTDDNGTNTKPLATFKIENEAKTRSFIVKTDAEGKFVINQADGSYTGTDNKKFWLIPGKYTITEQSAETLTDGCRFTVDTTAYEFTIVKDQTVVVSNETGNTGMFRNKPVRGALTLTKMDEKYIVVDGQLKEKKGKGELLGGAEFNICLDKAGTQVVTALVPVKNIIGKVQAGLYTLPADAASDLTNAIGVPYLSNGKLLCGTYYIVETGVPEGYYVKDSQSPKQVTIGADTNAAIVDVTPEMENTLIEQPFSVEKTYEVPNAVKYDAEGKKIGEAGKFVKADADTHKFTFTIERTSESTPAFEYKAEKTTDANGIADFGNIPYGTYTVTETAVDEYIANAVFTIVVNEKGVTYGDAVLTGGIAKVQNTLKRGSISGTVVDKEYNTGLNKIVLPGAEVGLYNKDGVLVAKVTTDENGGYSFADVPYGEYKVAEIKAPENYVLDSTPISVKIENNGDEKKLTAIENEPVRISLSIHKIDNETKGAMENVVFKLSGTDFRGKTVTEGTLLNPLKTDADGNITFSPVTVGTYTITETTVQNYEEPHSLTLTVTNQANEDGSSHVAVASLTDAAASAVTDGSVASLVSANQDGSYTITNVRIRREFSFTKTGTDDEMDLTAASVLAGAEFGLFEKKADAESYIGAEGQKAPVKTAVSNAEGTVTFTDIPCGTWYVKELSAPANYTVDSKIYTVTVAQDGTVTNELTTVVDEANRGTIAFTKVDKDHQNITIPGAKYTLYKKNAKTGAYDTVVTTAVSDQNGKVVFNNLLIGTDYRVTETKTVTNYLLAGNAADFSLKLINGAAVTQVDDNGNGTIETTASGLLWNEVPVKQPFSVEKTYEVPNAVKYDAEGKKIGEAGEFVKADADTHKFTFTIARTSDSSPAFTYTDTKTTDANGIADFGNIPYGTYTVTETAVDDYIANAVFTIVVNESGVTYGDAVLTGGVAKVQNTLKRGSISGTVVDKEYNTGRDKIVLPGAEVGLYNKDGVLVAKVTTDEKGAYSFADVPYGEYSVKEIKSPENYVLDSTPISVTIENNGDEKKLTAIENEPVRVSVSIHKIDNETGAGMADVEFTLAGTDFRGKKVNKTQKTDAAGNLTFVDITVGKEGSYTITEKKVMDYEEQHAFTLTVTNVASGNSNTAKAELADATSANAVGGSIVNTVEKTAEGAYTITNIRIRRDFTFRKTGTDDELNTGNASALAGATFGLFEKKADAESYTGAEGQEAPVQTATSDEKGTVTFTDIPCGTWYVKELQAPVNYTPDTKIYSITVEQNGNVTSNLETAVNEAIRGTIEFTKVDKDRHGLVLPGAEYTLYRKVLGIYVPLTTETSDESGKVVFNNLLIGVEYRVKETGTVTGYQLPTETADFVLELSEGKAVTVMKDSGNGIMEITDEGKLLFNEPAIIYDFKVAKTYEVPSAAAFDAEGAKIGEAGAYVAADNTDHSFTFTIERTAESVPAFTYIDTKTTDADGFADFGMIPYGTYTVTETAVDDYIANAIFTITVDEKGIKREGTLLKDGIAKVENNLKRGSISGTVVDAEYPDILLSGAEAGLYNKDGVLVAKVTTDENGAYSFENIPYGEYTVQEVKAPENYKINNNGISVSVKYSGEETVLEAIPDQPVRIPAVLHKIDNETGEALSDVEFTLEGTDFRGIDVEETLRTDENGDLAFTEVPVGKYTVTETKVMDYEAPHRLKLTVVNMTAGNSNVAVETLIDAYASGITDGSVPDLVQKETDGTYTITNIRMRRDFSFTKTGTTDELDPTKDTLLPGAVFGLYESEDASGEPVQTAASDADGVVTFTDIPCGTWYVKEISAPEGYTPDEKIYSVTVNQDGTIDSALEIVVNEAIRGEIMLTNIYMNTPNRKLHGTQYVLFRKDPVTGEYIELMTLTTDENGEVRFGNLLLGIEYRVEEISTTDGNQVSKRTADFILELENGVAVTKVVSAGDGTVEVTKDGNLIWNQPPTIVDIYKFDESEKVLAGAEFMITDENGKQVLDWDGKALTWTSGKDGAFRITGILVAGKTYSLTETKAPDGYQKADPITFVVDEVKSSPEELHVQEIKVVNKKLPASAVTPSKVDMVITGDGPQAIIWGALTGGSFTALLAFVLVNEKKRRKQSKKEKKN